MRYRRLKKAEGIRLFKDVVFLEIPLDFLHNSDVEGPVKHGRRAEDEYLILEALLATYQFMKLFFQVAITRDRCASLHSLYTHP